MSNILHNMTMSEYQATPAWNASRLKAMINHDAYEFHQQHIAEIPPECQKDNTDALLFGSVFHSLIDHTFEDLYVAMQPGQRRIKSLVEETAPRTLVPVNMHMLAHNMVEAIHNHPEIAPTLRANGTRLEPSVFWGWKGMELRARPDVLCYDNQSVWDWKTTRDVTPYRFAKDIYTFSHHVSAAMIIDGLDALACPVKSYKLVAIQKEWPFRVNVYELGEESIALGRRQYQDALTQLDRCLATDKWPKADTPHIIDVPDWAFGDELTFDGAKAF